jgi:hypothetical protein
MDQCQTQAILHRPGEQLAESFPKKRGIVVQSEIEGSAYDLLVKATKTTDAPTSGAGYWCVANVWKM